MSYQQVPSQLRTSVYLPVQPLSIPDLVCNPFGTVSVYETGVV